MTAIRESVVVIAAIIIAVFAVSVARSAYLAYISKKLVDVAVPYDRRTEDHARTMLVLGDSTAVGVGAASPEESVPGRVALHIGATYVENRAVSGATVSMIAEQIAGAQLPAYDLVLVQAGANDIVRFHDADDSAQELKRALEQLPPAGKTVIISAGDVGTARLIPFFLRPFHSRANTAYHRAFARAFSDSYVNLADGPGAELFAAEPQTYLAADRFHLSSAGYGLWADAITPRLDDFLPR